MVAFSLREPASSGGAGGVPPASAPSLSVPAISANGSYTVSWGTVSGATAYTLQQQLNGGSWSTSQNSSATSQAFSGKAAGNYGYRVRGCNAGGCGPWSAVHTVAVKQPPAAPSSVTAPSYVHGTAYTVSWSASSGSTSYKVRRTNTDTGASAIIATTASTHVGIAAPVNSQTLQYAVQACNANGCSGFRNAPNTTYTDRKGGAANRGAAGAGAGGRTMSIWQKIVLAGLLLIAGRTYAEDTVHYYYTDPQGTVLAKADAAGNVIASYDYAPYGSQALGTPPASGPTGYTGHVNDPDTGLVYMQARYYDPERGGFLSVDPAGPTVGNMFNFNRYGYANNNPVVNMDSDGRCTGSHIANGDGTCASSGSFTTRGKTPTTLIW